jgi:hypothetical protein
VGEGEANVRFSLAYLRDCDFFSHMFAPVRRERAGRWPGTGGQLTACVFCFPSKNCHAASVCIPNMCIERADAEEAIRRKIQAERDEMKAAAEADKDDDDEDDDDDDEQPLLFDKTFALKLWLTGSFSFFLSCSLARSLASVRACSGVFYGLPVGMQSSLLGSRLILVMASPRACYLWYAIQALDIVYGASDIFQ